MSLPEDKFEHIYQNLKQIARHLIMPCPESEDDTDPHPLHEHNSLYGGMAVDLKAMLNDDPMSGIIATHEEGGAADTEFQGYIALLPDS